MSFVEKHAKPVSAQEAAATFLTVCCDPNKKHYLTQLTLTRTQLDKLCSTLSGIAQGTITLGDSSLDPLVQRISEELRKYATTLELSSIRPAIQNVYAAGICVDKNPLRTPERGKGPVF